MQCGEFVKALYWNYSDNRLLLIFLSFATFFRFRPQVIVVHILGFLEDSDI